jgi:hypothetical protein
VSPFIEDQLKQQIRLENEGEPTAKPRMAAWKHQTLG